jgi:hypothetical protein
MIPFHFSQLPVTQVVSLATSKLLLLSGRTQIIVDDLKAQGFTGVRAIAAQLNERGILTPRGGTWHPTSAARLLARLQAAG